MFRRFRNRSEAGRLLARELTEYADGPDVIVLALPRGGVPVGCEIASGLHVPLDVCLVRKLGVPGQEELALGAIADGGVRVLNDDVVSVLAIPPDVIDLVTAAQTAELQRRERAYRGDRPFPAVGGQIVILVDDGLATGSTMQVAVRALRERSPAKIVVAVPVGARGTCAALRRRVDSFVCLMTPAPFYGVGLWCDDFSPPTVTEVRRLLAFAAQQAVAPRPAAGRAG